MKEDALTKIVLPQIEKLVKRLDALEQSEHYHDWSGVDIPAASAFVTAGLSAIHRAVGSAHPLTRHVETIVRDTHPYQFYGAVPHVGGALRALRDDIRSGYLRSVQELIHADVFSDFLEMAEHLLDQGYKDAAAVLIGGVLEGHLRKLCGKSGVDTEFVASSGDLRLKKADRMNADLAKSGVYSKLDQKNVTAWLGLRNSAAHGHYDDYSEDRVKLLLQSIRDFLARYPA
jgi:hypothetical protein